MNPPTKIFIKKSEGKGNGVFATADISKGEIIEVAPILVLQFEDFVDTRWNLLFEYYFWMDNEVILALGYGSLYNHSKENNALYDIDLNSKSITFTAKKDIKKGEEIMFDYKAGKTETPLWFEK